MLKVLFLVAKDTTKESVLEDAVNKSDTVNMMALYKPLNWYCRLLRKIIMTLALPGIGDFLNERIDFNQYEVIVVAASKYSMNILRYLKRKYPKKKYINYFWDKIKISGLRRPTGREEDGIEQWTFNSEDAKNFKIYYNPQFFSKYMISKITPVHDITYIGSDRGGTNLDRVIGIQRLYDKLVREGYDCDFSIQTNEKTMISESLRMRELISEKEFFEHLLRGRVILDYVGGEGWLTLRPLFALSNHRKLITDYVDIVEYPFYDTNNIFIIGIDDYNNLRDFVESPFLNIEAQIKGCEVSEWGKRFCENL